MYCVHQYIVNTRTNFRSRIILKLLNFFFSGFYVITNHDCTLKTEIFYFRATSQHRMFFFKDRSLSKPFTFRPGHFQNRSLSGLCGTLCYHLKNQNGISDSKSMRYLIDDYTWSSMHVSITTDR